MSKSKDLFDDTTMTFGEHLEALRIHLWKALIGLMLCVIVALFFGNHVINFVQGPINSALESYGHSAQDDVSGFNFIEYITGTLQMVGDEPQLVGDGFSELSQLELEHVDVRGTSVNAAALRALKKAHPDIELRFDPIAVAGLSTWRAFDARATLDDQFQLVSLTVRHRQFGDDELRELTNVESLRRLDLSGTAITDRGVRHIAEFPRLRTLVLSRTSIGNRALAALRSNSTLHELDVSRTTITDDGLESLQELSQLRRLSLGRTQITDSGLKNLESLTGLTFLNLIGAPITDAGLESVQNLKNLESLELSGAGITNEGMTSLAGLEKLERLVIVETAVTDEGLQFLAALPRLHELSFHDERSATGSRAISGAPIDAADERTITVSLQASQLAAALHALAPDAYPEPPADPDERSVRIAIAAPEFQDFRETTVNLRKPVTLNVQEAFMMYLKVAFITGLVIASPWVFYQLWLFVAAGLYPHERRYVHYYLPVSIGLFLAGALFCFYVVFPFVLHFLLSFNEWLGVTPQIRLSEWISFAIMLPVMFGLSFQLPMVMLFLERISIFDVADYREKRRLAILGIAIVSMFMTPADPMSMLLMMMPLMALYELGIWMCTVSPSPSSPFAEAAP